jgi:hypothetical protein
MAYGQRTKIFGIPVVAGGDVIDPATEMLKYRIIENLLMAGIGGKTDCVFDDGEFRVTTSDNDCSVSVSPGGGCPVAASGVVGGAYFNIPVIGRWAGLRKGVSHYLYVSGNTETFKDPEGVFFSAYDRPVAFSCHTLMAVVDYTGSSPVIDTNPPSKVYSEDIIRHTSDNDSPHGDELIQKRLVVSESILLKKGAKLLIEDDAGSSLQMSSGSAKETTVVVNILSPGISGVVVPIPNASSILFAQASAIHTKESENLPVGEISFGYYGYDDSADSKNEVVVYNSGSIGVPIRICAVCQVSTI